MPKARTITTGPARVLVVVALIAAACGTGGRDARRVRSADTVPTPTPTPVPAYVHPLTGVTFTGSQPWQGRPPLSVKVENSPASRPQSGLAAADLVYEELAEGGITRFIAVFQSGEADKIGPVRSARLVDPDVLEPLGGLFAYAGGVPPVIGAVRRSPTLTDVGVDRAPGAYWRQAGRQAPHNLYTSTGALWGGRQGAEPRPMFTFGEAPAAPADAPGASPSGEAGSAVNFSFAPQERMRYAYDPSAGVYRRFHGDVPHTLEDGSQVSAVNVVFQVVTVGASSIVDVNGQTSPDPKVTGEGDAVLLRGGRAYRGRWRRGAGAEPTVFQDSSGAPLLFAPGRTWIELLPAGRPLEIS